VDVHPAGGLDANPIPVDLESAHAIRL
jgi:hypothetical protein